MTIPTTPGSFSRGRTWIAATLAAAIVALTSALAAPSALADSDPGTHHHVGEDERIETAGGIAWFHHHGEILQVEDIRKDGLGVRAYLLEHGTKTVEDRGVSGGRRTRNLDIYEGAKVLLSLCYIHKDGSTAGCSQDQVAYA